MGIYKHSSSKGIIRKVMRDLRPNDDNWIDDAIEWIGEALEHIGASAQLCTKKSVLNIVDHKAVLPSDLYYINQVAINGTVTPTVSNELDVLLDQVGELKETLQTYNEDRDALVAAKRKGNPDDNVTPYSSVFTDNQVKNFMSQYKSNVIALNEINSRIIVLEGMFFNVEGTGGNDLVPLSYGASTFPDAIHCTDCTNQGAVNKDSYIIDCDYIKTSFPTGKVCLSYTAFPLDEECFPMVPDSISYKEAMFWYVFKQLLLGGWDKPTNKIDYNYADQKWKYYCTQARNESVFPDIDRMQSFMNQWVRLVPEVNAHELFFEEHNTKENLNRSI